MTVPQQDFGRSILTGGGFGSLDGIDGAGLNNGDTATVTTSAGIKYFYWLNATSGAAESSPSIISPNTNAGNKRWILSSIQANLLYGNGFVFPATQIASAGANTLDDYEEGYWTPGISFGGGTTGITYAANAGAYTKIGNACICSFQLTLSNKGSSTGAALLTGLPFTVKNENQAYGSSCIRYSAVSFADHLQSLLTLNSTTLALEQIASAGTYSALSDTSFANTSDLRGTIIFKVA